MSLVASKPCHWPDLQFRRGWIPGVHRGADFGYRSPVDVREKSKQNLAIAPGRVEAVTNNGGNNFDWGNRTIIRHTDRITSTYNHAVTGSARFRAGDIADAGDIVSIMGATGAATGIHNHLEIYLDGVRVDPMPYLNGKKMEGTPVVSGRPASGGSQPVKPSPYAQRTVKKVPNGKIRGRSIASTKGNTRQWLDQGDIGNFDGFARGETVEQNGVKSNVWFRGAFGHNWFWAGNFTSQSTSGMKDLTPKAAPTVKKFTTPPNGQFHYGLATGAKASTNYKNAQAGRRYDPKALPGGTTYNVVRNPGSGTIVIAVPGLGHVWVGTRRNPAKVK